MSKAKSISELVTELQQENESLQALKKHFNAAVKSEFGYGISELHRIIKNNELQDKKCN